MKRVSPRLAIPVLLVSILVAAEAVEGQLTLRDLVITAGASAEGYQGNLPAVSIPVTDSTEVVSALAGEFAIRGEGVHRGDGGAVVTGIFDGGIRQFAARGFELRDYAPREWVGTLDLSYARPLGSRAGMMASTRLRGRDIVDRPPMPLFLQPGYRSGEAAIALDFDGPRGVLYDAEVGVSRSDFLAPAFAPQVRLLDRTALRFEAGATLQGGASALRLFAGLEGSRYPKQTTFAADDPYRRDVTYQGGAVWTMQTSYLAQVAIEGRANRSNSRRPEYDSLTLRGLFTASLPQQLSISIYGALTAKQYLHGTSFARLLPGEEANNASLAYVSLSRSIARNLDATFRVGWTRAETEIGDAYFQRFGGTVLLHFRPGF
jgi:hypothetical protein